MSELLGLQSIDSVKALEDHLFDLQQVNLGTSLLIHGKMCARTIMIPAGTVLTGAQTNIDNICVMFGDVTVTTADGVRRLTGFNVLPAVAGFKRACIAHADTYWTTLHHTELADVAEIEREMTDETDLLQTTRFAIAEQRMATLEAK